MDQLFFRPGWIEKPRAELIEEVEQIIRTNNKEWIIEGNYSEYLQLFSMVFQDFGLFSFSLGQNIAASTDYDEDDVVSAIKDSGFNERFKKLPKGLDTYLYQHFEKEGVEISGGEAQKVVMARAIYKDAPFVILDEPTAAPYPHVSIRSLYYMKLSVKLKCFLLRLAFLNKYA